jgi:heme oxygenase
MDQFNLKLKSATESLHRSVETTPISKAIMSHTLTPEEYGQYLHKMHVIHHSVEHVIFPTVNTVIKDVMARVKTPFITSDIAKLGSKADVSGYPLFDDDYKNNLNFNLGMLYVTEGSVLGGLYILKNVKQILGFETPGSFLNVYGEKTGSIWKNFIEQLNTYALTITDDAADEIIAGALYGFKRVGMVFSKDMLVPYEN